MTEGGSGSIQLLEADPELARGLDPRRIREVSQRLFVRAVTIPRGSWSPERMVHEGSQPIGLLVLEGLLVREAVVGDHPSAELLGPGDRLLALLWCLAERWGRVVPGGVLVTLRLPHRTLAGMVGARRPSVTTALGQLMARGDIERRPDGSWLLRGQPPEPRAQPDDAMRLERRASF